MLRRLLIVPLVALALIVFAGVSQASPTRTVIVLVALALIVYAGVKYTMSLQSRLLAFRVVALAALAGSAFELVRPLLNGEYEPLALKFGLAIAGWPVPLPWLGLGAALSLLLLSFAKGPCLAQLRSGLSLVGGGVALWLLFVQVAVFQSLSPACWLVNYALLVEALIEGTRATAPSGPPAHAPRS
jgi:hypothetical protein